MAKKATKFEKIPDPADTILVNSQDAVKKMIADAKEVGYITYDAMNEALPQDQMSSEQIENVMTMLSEMGIKVIDNADAEIEEVKPKKKTTKEKKVGVALKADAKAPIDRTDDPVRMYLREMGSVELLSREGEIAIAKRIEAGRATMIFGLCDSPLTFDALAAWGKMLEEEEILLRDVIDLDAMYNNDPTRQSAIISSVVVQEASDDETAGQDDNKSKTLEGSEDSDEDSDEDEDEDEDEED